MEHDYVGLSRLVLAVCRERGADGAGAARACSTALAALIKGAEDPGLLLALVTRDLAEAAMRGRSRIQVGDIPPPRPRRRAKGTVLQLVRKRRDRHGYPPKDREPA